MALSIVSPWRYFSSPKCKEEKERKKNGEQWGRFLPQKQHFLRCLCSIKSNTRTQCSSLWKENVFWSDTLRSAVDRLSKNRRHTPTRHRQHQKIPKLPRLENCCLYLNIQLFTPSWPGQVKKRKYMIRNWSFFFFLKKKEEKETKARNGSLFESVSRIWASRIWWAIESCAIAIFEPRTEQNSYPTPPPTVLVGSPPPFIDNCLPDGLMSILHCYSSSCMFLGGVRSTTIETRSELDQYAQLRSTVYCSTKT